MGTLPAVEAPRIPVTSSYHGLDVTEDYRWLEDADSPETVAWTQAQRELPRTLLVRQRPSLRQEQEQLHRLR